MGAPSFGPVRARARRRAPLSRECPGRAPNYEVVVEFTSLIEAFVVGVPRGSWRAVRVCKDRVYVNEWEFRDSIFFDVF